MARDGTVAMRGTGRFFARRDPHALSFTTSFYFACTEHGKVVFAQERCPRPYFARLQPVFAET